MTAPTTLDDFVDPQVAALLALCKAALNANLQTASPSTIPTVRATYGWPAKPTIGNNEYPVLLIYRQSESTLARTTKHLEQVVTFAFEYCAGPTAVDVIDRRWRLPPLVWKELVRVIRKGHDPSCSSDALILRSAGFVWTDETKRNVIYSKPTDAPTPMPGFVGTMVLHHRDEIDISALQDLLSLDAQHRLINGGTAAEQAQRDQLRDDPDPHVEQPLVEQIHLKP